MFTSELFINDTKQPLDYVKKNAPEIYDDVVLKIEEIEKDVQQRFCNNGNEVIDFGKRIETRNYLSSVVMKVFESCGQRFELSHYYSSDLICKTILSKEKEIIVGGKYTIIDDDCFKFSNQVEVLIFENGIEHIAKRGCCNLPNLKRVYFPETLKSIGTDYFSSCINLEKVYFASKNTAIDSSSFANTKWFSVFEDEFVIVNGQLLKYNGNSEDVVIPEGVVSIKVDVFSENEIVKKVIFPESLKSIDVSAFADCHNLREIVFQNDDMDTILPMAFDNCINLKRVVLPKNLNVMGILAFEKNTVIVCNKNNIAMVECLSSSYPNCEFIEW